MVISNVIHGARNRCIIKDFYINNQKCSQKCIYKRDRFFIKWTLKAPKDKQRSPKYTLPYVTSNFYRWTLRDGYEKQVNKTASINKWKHYKYNKASQRPYRQKITSMYISNNNQLYLYLIKTAYIVLKQWILQAPRGNCSRKCTFCSI